MHVDVDLLSAALDDVCSRARSTPVGLCDAGGLALLLASARDAQAALDALVVQIGVRADELADEGRSAPAADLLLGGGRVGGTTARAEAARSAAVGRLPGVDDLVAKGRIGTDQLDALARFTRGRWTIALEPDRALAITRPDGVWHDTTDPPGRWRDEQRTQAPSDARESDDRILTTA